VVGPGPAAVAVGGEGLTVPEDLHEAWAERVAIMVADGGMPHADAACVAWEGLHPEAAAR